MDLQTGLTQVNAQGGAKVLVKVEELGFLQALWGALKPVVSVRKEKALASNANARARETQADSSCWNSLLVPVHLFSSFK